jgi:hypothetical protein
VPHTREHPVGTSNIATTPVAAATALMVFLEFFDFIVVPFREGQIAVAVNDTSAYPPVKHV